MRSNPEIEKIIVAATVLAKEYKHQYVTLEHLSAALIEFPDFHKLLDEFGVDVENLLRDIYDWIGRQDNLVSLEDDVTPQRRSEEHTSELQSH